MRKMLIKVYSAKNSSTVPPRVWKSEHAEKIQQEGGYLGPHFPLISWMYE